MKQVAKLSLTSLIVLAANAWTAFGMEKITQIVDPHSDAPKVLLSSGTNAGFQSGDTMIVYRFANPRDVTQNKIVTGRLKILETKEELAMAQVTADGSEIAKAAFPKFPGVMAGDYVEKEVVEVMATQKVMPELSLGYDKLFVDPKSLPVSFEVSFNGKEALKDVAEQFAGLHVENLLIEAHTDARGPADVNQIESQQRAMTIRQYLISNFGFDEDRIIAIGQGENEALDAHHIPGDDARSRRIVFRVIN